MSHVDPSKSSSASPPFLRALFGHALIAGDSLCIRALRHGAGDSRQQFYEQLDGITTDPQIPKWNTSHSIYFGTAIRSSAHPEKAKKAGCVAITALWADLDAKDFVKPVDPKSPTVEERKHGKKLILEALKTKLPAALQPSILVDTGGGYQAYWLLHAPFRIGIDGSVLFIENTLAGLHAQIGADPARKDITSIMRLPGTVNCKYPDRPMCRVIGIKTERRFSLADFAPYRIEPATRTASPAVDPEAGQDFPALLDAIKAKGLYLKRVGDGHFITCPWKDVHTTADTESGTELFDPAADNGHAGGFKCQHGHCADRKIGDVYALFIPPVPKPFLDTGATVDEAWPAPLPIPDDMPAAPELTHEMLPPDLADWIFDIAHRMQCPPDYPAAAALVALGTVVGKKVQLFPKHHDNWSVVPNLWGFVVGAPGVLKSPATKQALGPIFRISQEERDKAAKEAGRIEAQAGEIERLKIQIKAAKKGDDLAMLKEELAVMEKNMAEEKLPAVRRLITNDATVEKLGILLNQNPNGILIEREELTGLFHSMEQEGHQQDRSFYLESWDGRNSKAIDRVGRGSLWVPSCVVSIQGTIQPEPLARYLLRYRTDGQADGFVERFQVSVFPEPRPWGYVDQAPNLAAIDQASLVYTRLHALASEEVVYLHFSAEAQALFIEWWTWLEKTLARNPKVHPLLQSHFSKYRSLMPSLALLFQLALSSTIVEVGLPATQMAAAWCNYLAGHVRRVYWPVIRPGGGGMQLLADHLPALEGQRLTVRDIERKGWSGLQASAVIEAGLKALATLHWVRPEKAGRWGTETRWAINPSLSSLSVISGGGMNSLSTFLPSSC